LQQGTDRIVYGLGPLYIVRADGTTAAFARDGLGSVRAEVTGTGSSSVRYRAYGEVAQFSGAANPSVLGYAGQPLDPSGLYYMRARWYDPTVGRFTTRDAFSGTLLAPSSLNGCAYADGRPTLLRDPLGLVPDASSADYASFDTYGVYSSVSAGFFGTYWTVQFAIVRTSSGEVGATFTPGFGGSTAVHTAGFSAGGLMTNAKRLSELKEWFGQVGGSNKIGRVVGLKVTLPLARTQMVDYQSPS
jgi:RHS repeat-associated protein